MQNLDTDSCFSDLKVWNLCKLHHFLHFAPRINVVHASKAKSVAFRERNLTGIGKRSFLLHLTLEKRVQDEKHFL